MLTERPILIATGTILCYYVLRFFYRLHWNRSLYKGLHGPPHSYLWGSLLAINEVVRRQPKRVAPQCYQLLVQEKYHLKDYFYADLWPFGPPSLIILNADMLQDFAVRSNLPKHPVIEEFVRHIGGPGNLVTAEGGEWKKWRAAFHPGFSNSHLMTLVPLITDQVLVFVDILTQKAKDNQLFRMEPATTRLTADIIGKVVLDTEFNSQRGSNKLVDTLINQINWQPVAGQVFLREIDVRRPFVMKYNTWKMDRYISRILDARFATRSERGKTKCIIDLALEAYLKENKSDINSKQTKLDPTFKEGAINNMKVFLFAGHDTTSSTICYCYYYLSRDSACLATLTKELDEVLGPDPSPIATSDKLKVEPHLLSKLEYCTAVVREALRLQPPANTARMGQRGFFLRDPETGEQLPTEHFMLWPVNSAIQRSSKYWSDPHSFIPERFMDGAGYNKDAWIAFSKGTRNCIGQDLALMEVKIILAMTVRMFEVKMAYDEVSKLKGDGSGYRSETNGVQEMFGEEAYQVQVGGAKPREGLPVRVSMRNEMGT